MNKLPSTFPNMVMSLTCITLVAAAALAGVFLLTEAQIEQQKREAQDAARIAVLAGHEDGVAIEAQADGFGGVIRLMVGFDKEGHILGYEVLEQQETPGLGTHIVEWFKNADKPGQNIIGREANGHFKVSKDGGDVDAITAATISSRAFLSAVNDAYAQFRAQYQEEEVEKVEEVEEVEAWTGASTMTTDTIAETEAQDE